MKINQMIKENTKAPIFKLPSTNNNIYSLIDSLGKYIVIYFYPKDDTPGCTIETNDFNKLLSKFKNLISKYWDNFYNNCLDRHDPFEKYINEIYKKEICISPLKSLSLHLTNINSSYGLSPFIDYKKLWEENNIND